jgi:hypothetical protein
MKRIYLSLILLICLNLNAELILNHDIPQKVEGSQVELKFDIIDGFDSITGAQLFYRFGNDDQYNMLELENQQITQNEISIMLDIDKSKQILQYYLQIAHSDGSSSTLPEVAPQMNPFKLDIVAEQTFDDNFILLSPGENDNIANEDITIAISFLPIADEIVVNSFQVKINNTEISDNVEVYSNMAIIKISNFKKDDLNIQVSAVTKSGKMLKSKPWSIAVDQKKVKFELPLHTVGSLSAGGYIKNISYSEQDSLDSDRKVGYTKLSMNGKYKLLKFRTSIYATSLESSKKQAINRYKFQLSVPHWKLNLGDYSPDLGSFVMNSKNVRGFHTALEWKYFRMQAVYGQSKRTIDGKVYQDTSGINVHKAGDFQRNTIGLRTEFGSKNGFNFGLGIAKNKDEVSSLDDEYYIDEDGRYIAKAKDNFVTGFDFEWAFLERRFVLGAESAVSMYNNDINDGAITQDSLESFIDDDIPFNPADWEDVFVINKNLVPFLPNTSNLAYKAYLNTMFLGNYLTVSFTEVGGSFRSLSASTLPQDTRTISVSDNLNMFDNRVSLSLGANIISDNVADQKEITTESTNWYANVMYSPNSRIFVRTGYSDTKSEGKFEDESSVDSLTSTHDNGNSDINFSIGYFADNIPNAPTRFTFSTGINKYQDNNADYENNRNNYTLGAVSYFVDFPVVSTIQYTFSNTDYDQQSDYENNYSSVYGKLDFKFLDDKVKPYTSYRYTMFGGEELDRTDSSSKLDVDKSTYDYGLGVKWQALENTELSSQLNMYGYSDVEDDTTDYSRFKISMNIRQRF